MVEVPPGRPGPEWGKPDVESSHNLSVAEGVGESKDKWPCRSVETLQSLVYLCFSPVDFRKRSLNPEGGSAGLSCALTPLLLLNRATPVLLSASFGIGILTDVGFAQRGCS